jgi:hypothetical protein
METWKEAGIPLEAVLRGIDVTFDNYERRPSKTRKINGLAWCSQEILAAAEDMKDAATGAQRATANAVPGMDHKEIAAFFTRNAADLCELEQRSPAGPVRNALHECSESLEHLAKSEQARESGSPQLDELERTLTILEEKLLAALTVAASESELVSLRAEADREIAPYRNKMPGFQIEQLRKQFVHKKLFEKAKISRLSLFYM